MTAVAKPRNEPRPGAQMSPEAEPGAASAWLGQIAYDVGLSDLGARLAAALAASLPPGGMTTKLDLAITAQALARSERAVIITVRELAARGHVGLAKGANLHGATRLKLLLK